MCDGERSEKLSNQRSIEKSAANAAPPSLVSRLLSVFVKPQVLPCSIEAFGRMDGRSLQTMGRIATLAVDPYGDAHAGVIAAGAATARYRTATRELWHRVSHAMWRGNGRMLATLLAKLRAEPAVSEAAAAQIKKDAKAAAAAAAMASAVLAAAGGVVGFDDDEVGGDDAAGAGDIGAVMMGGAVEAQAGADA